VPSRGGAGAPAFGGRGLGRSAAPTGDCARCPPPAPARGFPRSLLQRWRDAEEAGAAAREAGRRSLREQQLPAPGRGRLRQRRRGSGHGRRLSRPFFLIV